MATKLWICLSIVDCLICLFVIFPLAIFHWRGTWDLLAYYIFPSQHLVSYWICLALGLNGCLLGYIIQPYLGENLKQRSCSDHVLYIVTTRIFLYAHGWAMLCFWRGLWELLDYYLTYGWLNSLLLYVATQLLSFVLQSSRTHVGLPLTIQLDTDCDLMKPNTQFQVEPKRAIVYIMDSFFTMCVTITFNVIIWRGIWNVVDEFLYPEDELRSDVGSLVFGFVGISILFLLQSPLSLISSKLESRRFIYKLIYEDFIFFIAGWANLLLWRGAWNLCIAYVIPDKLIGGWSCHVIGAMGLMIIQCFNNVGTNGVEIDGSFPGGKGIFPNHYLRGLLHNKLQKLSTNDDGSRIAFIIDEVRLELKPSQWENYQTISKAASSL